VTARCQSPVGTGQSRTGTRRSDAPTQELGLPLSPGMVNCPIIPPGSVFQSVPEVPFGAPSICLRSQA
jgi:hypothetical protein